MTTARQPKDQAIEVVVPTTGEVVPLNYRYIANGQATRTGLTLPEGLSFEEWATIGDALSAADQSIMWWVGDWWAYGEKSGEKWGYGDRSRMLDKLREAGHNPPSFKTCKQAGWLARRFERSSRLDLLSFGHHEAVAKLDDREASWLLERAQANSWTRQELRDEVRRYKLEKLRRPGERKYQTQTVEDLYQLIEQGKRFSTIYADPPWPYGNQGTRAATRKHYKAHNELSVEDICALPVSQFSEDNAHCHLWTTNGFLREAFDVMAAWGFTYKSIFVWVKPDFGIGNYWRVGAEYMLFGMKGKAPFGDNSEQNWVYEKAGEHSAKPAKVRRIIEKVSPGPYLEMFGRREVENWTVWGNEVERIVERQGFDFDGATK